MRVPIDRTENDPGIFRAVLHEFEQGPIRLPSNLRPAQRDAHGRFIKKEKHDA